jgi:hypothetical protein
MSASPSPPLTRSTWRTLPEKQASGAALAKLGAPLACYPQNFSDSILQGSPDRRHRLDSRLFAQAEANRELDGKRR